MQRHVSHGSDRSFRGRSWARYRWPPFRFSSEILFPLGRFYPAAALLVSEAFMWHLRVICVFGVLGAIIGGAIGLMFAFRKK